MKRVYEYIEEVVIDEQAVLVEAERSCPESTADHHSIAVPRDEVCQHEAGQIEPELHHLPHAGSHHRLAPQTPPAPPRAPASQGKQGDAPPHESPVAQTKVRHGVPRAH